MTEPKAVKKAVAKPSAFKAPVPNSVTCEFGKKGALWAAGFHTGVDYGSKRGTNVSAVADGVVIAANWGPAYGLQVIIQHGSHRFLYAHLDHKEPIPAGTKVKQGQILGRSGATGNAAGPHLHLEARTAPYRYAIDAVDPRSCLK